MESSSSNQESVALEEIEVAYPSQELIDLKEEQSTKIECRNELHSDSEPDSTVEQLNDIVRFEEIAIQPKEMNPDVDEVPEDLLVHPMSLMVNELKKASKPESDDGIEEPQTQHTLFKVNSDPCAAMNCDNPSKELGELVLLLIELMEIRLSNWRNDSLECLKTPSAHTVFVEMPSRGVHLEMGLLVDGCFLVHHSCKQRGSDVGGELKYISITLPYDRGKVICVAWAWMITIDSCVGVCDTKRERSNVWSFSPGRYPAVFDTGGFVVLTVSKKDELNRRMISWLDLSSSIMSIKGGHRLLDEDLIFDPG